MTASRKALAVSRTGPDLDINDEATYFLLEDGLEIGQVTYRRDMVEGRFTESQYQVGAVRDISEGNLAIAVRASTQSGLQSALATLIDAMTQWSFTLQLTIDSVDWSWACYAAEYAVSFKGPWIDDATEPIAIAAFSFPRHPAPVDGPF